MAAFLQRLVFKDFREFVSYFLTTKTTGEDGAVRSEEDDVWNAFDAIDVHTDFLRIKNLRIGNLVFL